MKAFILGAAITLAFSGAAYAQAPSWTVPAESQRCPSKWGASDERGSANHQKPAAVMNAAKLIKSGEVIELAHVLGPSMAFFGTRRGSDVIGASALTVIAEGAGAAGTYRADATLLPDDSAP